MTPSLYTDATPAVSQLQSGLWQAEDEDAEDEDFR
jgi:hypothetical protein